MDKKGNGIQPSINYDQESNDGYKSAINLIAGLNNKASILASQTSFISRGLLSSSLVHSLSDISRQYSKMSSIYDGLPDISRVLQESSALVAARSANLSISRLIGSNLVVEMSKVLQEKHSSFAVHNSLAALSNPLSSYLQHEQGLARLASLPMIDKSTISLFAANSSIGRIAEYSLLAEKNFAVIEMACLGSQISMDEKYRPLLSETLTNYSKSFSDLWESYESTPRSFVELSPTLVRIPPIEYFNTSSIIEKISFKGNDDAEEELLTSDLLIENEETLTSLLPKMNPDLLNLWLGAKQALESDNIDKVRHFATSARELITQVLHILSPDNDLIRWTNNPVEHIQNGKPTRKARLLFILRDINNDHFKSFIEADIKAVLQFIDLFQEGAHSVKSKLTDNQLMALKLKAESTLKYLLQIYYETK